MYAFNKRFRPTLYFGAFTLLTVALALLSVLLLAFAAGAVIQLKKPAVALIFLLCACLAIYGAVRDHLSLRTLRIRASIQRGQSDRRAKRMEVIHGR